MASQITRRFLTTTARRMQQTKSAEELKKESKRNPELIVLGSVMVATLAGAGFYFGSSPTASTDERHVKMSKDGMPWESGTEGKYKYHPGGDPNQEPRDAPSALNTVIVPNVTLPRELHEKFNKWGKDGY